MGKTKFLPTLSPNKSREGSSSVLKVDVIIIISSIIGFYGCVLFGLVTSLLCGPIFRYFNVPLPFSIFEFIFFGIVIPLIAICGDLCESFLKRCHNRKDCGSYLPGWGGIFFPLVPI